MFFNKKSEITFPLIDMHEHLLYHIDDGSHSYEESIKMLEIAYHDGIRIIIATPHFHPGKCTKSIDHYISQFNQLNDYTANYYHDMKLYLGREVYYTSDVIEELDTHTDFFMNISSYILIEYSTSTEYHYIKNSINSIIQEGLTPIIAHVERYGTFLSNRDSVQKIQDLRNMGALIQVNANSYMGDTGKEPQKLVKNLLREETVDLVATDAHSCTHRTPVMKDCITSIAHKYGIDYAKKIAYDNQISIINNQYVK